MKRMVLTFDDGPNPPYTSMILDILKKHKARAIFFLLGYNVKRHPKVALRIKQEGHIIGNHSFSHKDLKGLFRFQIKREIEKTERIFSGALGIKPKLFRGPYGNYNKKVEDVVKSKGYKTLNWDICPQDWESLPAETIAERVISQAKDGAVVLLHDGSNIRQGKSRIRTVCAVEIIIKKLKNRGFVFDTGIYL